jgi:uncharacterized protein (DUF58 family)
MQTRINSKTRLLWLLTGVLVVLTFLDDYQGWRFLLLGLAGAWGASYLWARSLGRNLRLQREMRFGWAQVGDKLEERFILTNRSNLPGLWIEVEDHSTLPDYQVNLVTGVDGRASIQWRTDGLCTRRGLFNLGPTTLHTSDPLGLYQVKLYDPRSVQLMVTPPIVPLPQIEVAPGGKAGEGRPKPNAPERTVSASGVREYVPGDTLRWIHWRTSARRGELFIRQFDSTPSGDWWIILDADESVQAGSGATSTEEHAVILAASLADRGLRLGRAVGLVAYGEPLIWLPPRQGDGQRWEILRSLALLKPAQRPLGDLLAGLRTPLGRQASLVIITPNARGNWLESLLPLLWQGAVPSVLLLDPLTFGGLGDAKPLFEQLARWGVYRQLITPELLDRPEAKPGKRGHWEWRISPTGRAIAVNPPRDAGWKTLQ